MEADNIQNRFVLRPHGFGRFGEAAFLFVWLCFWVVGEVSALFALGFGIWSLLTGRPIGGQGEPLGVAPALGAGAFLLVWLTIWTFGGVMALRQFLRAVWASDTLTLETEALICRHRLGPLDFTRRYPINDLHRIFVESTSALLKAQVGTNVVELSTLGSPVDRKDVAEQLQALLKLPGIRPEEYPGALPDSWQQVSGPLGEVLLVPNLKTRHGQAIAVAVVTLVVWAGLFLLAAGSTNDPNLWVATLMLAMLGAWLLKKTHWMFRGRPEWLIGDGRLVSQRRMGDEVTEILEARALELTENSDGESTTYELRAIELSPTGFNAAGRVPKHVVIDRKVNDLASLRCLGQWISEKAGVICHDRIPDEAARQAEMARLKESLGKAGPLGRAVVGLIDYACRRSNKD